jgi:hypothetical protein
MEDADWISQQAVAARGCLIGETVGQVAQLGTEEKSRQE